MFSRSLLDQTETAAFMIDSVTRAKSLGLKSFLPRTFSRDEKALVTRYSTMLMAESCAWRAAGLFSNIRMTCLVRGCVVIISEASDVAFRITSAIDQSRGHASIACPNHSP